MIASCRILFGSSSDAISPNVVLQVVILSHTLFSTVGSNLDSNMEDTSATVIRFCGRDADVEMLSPFSFSFRSELEDGEDGGNAGVITLVPETSVARLLLILLRELEGLCCCCDCFFCGVDSFSFLLVFALLLPLPEVTAGSIPSPFNVL